MSLQIPKVAPVDQVVSGHLAEEVRQGLHQARTSRGLVQLSSPKAERFKISFRGPSQDLYVAARQPLRAAIGEADLELTAQGNFCMRADTIQKLLLTIALASPGQNYFRRTAGDAPLNETSSSFSRPPARTATYIHNWPP